MDAAKKLIVQKLTRDVFDNQVKLADVTTAEIEAFTKPILMTIKNLK